HGGLTILRALVDHMPQRSFLYFGDHAHIPYGERTSAEIVMFTRSAVDLLFKQGCRLVILACNTAAAVAAGMAAAALARPPHSGCAGAHGGSGHRRAVARRCEHGPARGNAAHHC